MVIAQSIRELPKDCRSSKYVSADGKVKKTSKSSATTSMIRQLLTKAARLLSQSCDSLWQFQSLPAVDIHLRQKDGFRSCTSPQQLNCQDILTDGSDQILRTKNDILAHGLESAPAFCGSVVSIATIECRSEAVGKFDGPASVRVVRSSSRVSSSGSDSALASRNDRSTSVMVLSLSSCRNRSGIARCKP